MISSPVSAVTTTVDDLDDDMEDNPFKCFKLPSESCPHSSPIFGLQVKKSLYSMSSDTTPLGEHPNPVDVDMFRMPGLSRRRYSMVA